MNSNEYIDKAEQFLVHAYNRYNVVIDKGDGVWLYDVEGKKYLDFAAGIAVFALGYNNKYYNDALKTQIDKVIHTPNLYYNTAAGKAAERLVKLTGLEKVFFANSGTEAIEGAIKMAKRYAYDRDGHGAHEIIAMGNSFHGRTMGALAVTGNKRYQEPFGPMIEGVKFAEYNNLDSVKSLVTDKTCAIILETVQGEGGIYPATEEFIKGIRQICDEKDIIMICDEVQCGMGRTGKMLAYEHYGIKPDIVAMAKALGCGIPVGAFIAGKKTCNSLVPGDHGTTYGGNPLATTAINAVLDIYEESDILDNVNKVGAYLEEKLEEIVSQYDNVTQRRGKGLMQGIVLTTPVGEAVKRCIENGLLVLSAGSDVLRMVPPLIITKENVDEMIEILRKSL